MKKWYNVEIPYNTRENIKRADNFKNWLTENEIKFETSGVDDFVHFEILLNADMLPMVNNAIDKIIWFDAITEK